MVRGKKAADAAADNGWTASATPSGTGLPASVLTMLQSRIGLDPASIGPAMIERAVRARASVRSAGDLEKYLLDLDSNPAEFQSLVDAVVVPETWFFRHPESLAAMTAVALRRLAQKTVGQLRILSLPCSTGEEPYSIAMALLSAGVAPSRFVIDAVDISEGNVDATRQAVYGQNSFRSPDLTFRDRYFTQEGQSGFALLTAVRAQVRVHLGNLLSPLLALPKLSYDLVFCRNLLIYFDQATQLRAIQILSGLAQTDGLLFVGPAEASVLTRMRHKSIGVPMAFAFHAMPSSPMVAQQTGMSTLTGALAGATLSGKTSAVSPSAAATSAWPRPAAALSQWAQPRASLGSAPAALVPGRTSLSDAQPSSPLASMSGGVPLARTSGANAVLSTTMPPQAALARSDAVGSVTPTVEPAQQTSESESFAAMNALADRGCFEEALAACTAHLLRFGPSATAFYRQGLFHDAARRPEAAQEAYRKTLYLEPHHPQALLQLAALLEAAGDADGAARLRRRMSRREAPQ